MIVPSAVLLSLAVILSVLLERGERGSAARGVSSGLRQMVRSLPVIIVALILAGMIEAVIPSGFVRDWMSAEAGFRGVILGVAGGALLAMGPYAAYPIIASVHSAGAGLGTTVALLTGWSLLGLSRLPYELGFMGVSFTLRRIAVALIYSLLAGAAVQLAGQAFAF
ncbi:MAG: permease [Bacillota bacterium]